MYPSENPYINRRKSRHKILVICTGCNTVFPLQILHTPHCFLHASPSLTHCAYILTHLVCAVDMTNTLFTSYHSALPLTRRITTLYYPSHAYYHSALLLTRRITTLYYPSHVVLPLCTTPHTSYYHSVLPLTRRITTLYYPSHVVLPLCTTPHTSNYHSVLCNSFTLSFVSLCEARGICSLDCCSQGAPRRSQGPRSSVPRLSHGE